MDTESGSLPTHHICAPSPALRERLAALTSLPFTPISNGSYRSFYASLKPLEWPPNGTHIHGRAKYKVYGAIQNIPRPHSHIRHTCQRGGWRGQARAPRSCLGPVNGGGWRRPPSPGEVARGSTGAPDVSCLCRVSCARERASGWCLCACACVGVRACVPRSPPRGCLRSRPSPLRGSA